MAIKGTHKCKREATEKIEKRSSSLAFLLKSMVSLPSKIRMGRKRENTTKERKMNLNYVNITEAKLKEDSIAPGSMENT